MGLLMDKFRQFLREFSARDMSEFSFPDDNFSKFQSIFTKLVVIIDVVTILFGFADGNFFVIFWQSYLPAIFPYFHLWMIT